MNCKKIRLMIDDTIYKRAAGMEPAVVAHIKTCKNCAGYHDFWLHRMDFAPAKAPAGLTERVMERVFSEKMEPSAGFPLSHFLKYAVASVVTASVMLFIFARFYVAQTTIPVTFKISDENAVSIALAGDFNDWQSDKILLKRKGDVWEATVRLKPNRYQYMFVIDGERFVPDPEANMYADDGFGHKNSVIDISGA
ncbi:MAG: hypothetical protein A2314_07290 [Elusimicrobia bacterium RIFOXYB2_FULL_50_12]|nr:MAG: hypothetical protein A2314_07290 [Elusimicrobia bacterium RIFOXYB2_FULL_50_12]